MSTGLLGPDGQPISSAQNKKAPAPDLGEKYGGWGGPDVNFLAFPGGGALQFDLSKLTLEDFRQMRDHYQINSSLTVLTFLLHQMEWRIVCDNKVQQNFYTEQLEGIWTPLVRSKAQAFWAGFSPNILQWENDTPSRRITLTKVKDLVPEFCHVNWKKVDGKGTEKINVYDGIKRLTANNTVPVENSYWYPLLMENGDYYGKKLLRSAFQPWFFSLLVHLFANRYYERFGEPTPVGRAPYDDEVQFNGKTVRGNQAMEQILTQLRNRSVAVLPSQKTQYGDETTLDYDYQVEYLESQMRGADFERYLTRLDEEMSLALFTPILLMRTADVGSYNLGTQHSVIYQWLLNAIGGDWKYYIDWYILRPLRDYNFGTNASRPRIEFARLGARNQELVNNVVAALIKNKSVDFDYDQLGEIAGLTLKEVKTLTAPPATSEEPPADPATPDTSTGDVTENRERVDHIVAQLSERIERQVVNAFKTNSIATQRYSLGFQRQLEDAFKDCGVFDARYEVEKLYSQIEAMVGAMGQSGMYASAESFMKAFDSSIQFMVNKVI